MSSVLATAPAWSKGGRARQRVPSVRLLCSFVVAAAATVAACRSSPAGEAAPSPKPAASAHADEPEHEELPKKVRLDADVVREAGITTDKVRRVALEPTLVLPGEVTANPDRSARVSSPVAGRVESVKVVEGGIVKKGDVVAVLRVPDLGKVRGALAATSAKAKAARANEARLRGLNDVKLTSEQTYLDAKAEADALEAESRALLDQLAALGAGSGGASPFFLSLRAPITGVVVARDAVIGQPISSEHVLAHVADLGEVWFLARVFEKDLGRLRAGASAEIELNAYPKERFPGVLEYIGQQIDPVARTVTARVRLANPGGRLRIGLFGMARVGITEEPKRDAVLVVPRTALVEVAGKTVVFVRHADGDYELHEVVVGDSAPGYVEIVSGLREGEEVVSSGAFTLKSVVLKGTMADGD